MEEKKINAELGHIYGSRISKNGNWLNLSITTIIEGKTWRITCPVRIAETSDKPHAEIGTGTQRYASIYGIKVYEDAKPKQESDEIGDLPF